MKMGNLVTDIMNYEEGKMDEDEVIPFFQRLVDTGVIWHLQGAYQRAAQILIDRGEISIP
jgi:hypothetical protein